jgi:hypothetical protein
MELAKTSARSFSPVASYSFRAVKTPFSLHRRRQIRREVSAVIPLRKQQKHILIFISAAPLFAPSLAERPCRCGKF